MQNREVKASSGYMSFCTSVPSAHIFNHSSTSNHEILTHGNSKKHLPTLNKLVGRLDYVKYNPDYLLFW